MDYYQNSDIPTELIIGIIGPIGCNRELIITTFETLSKHFTYSIEIIKVSDLINSTLTKKINDSNQYKRVTKLMNAGNSMRNDAGDNSLLAKMAAVSISKARKKYDNHKVIYVIDSLKHPEEVTTLRDIYGNGFYLFAIHSDESQRDDFLKRECCIENENERQELINRDKGEGLGYGQSTSSAFHLADFFLTENGDKTKVWHSLERYFDLIFGNPFRTPTFQEYSMFMAHAASIRSSDLSRQVGAVIASGTDIISSGANECLKLLEEPIGLFLMTKQKKYMMK